jgi:cytochrome P450
MVARGAGKARERASGGRARAEAPDPTARGDDVSADSLSFSGGLRSLGKDRLIARLHDEAPLFRDPDGFWVASSFEDVRAILLDHARFSSSAMGGGQLGFPLLSDDPPRHSVLRALLAKAFTPASIAAMRPDVEKLAHELVARIPQGDEVDAVDAIAAPLPVTVIARMLGIPETEQKNFRRWSDAIVGAQNEPMTGARLQTFVELRDYFARVSAERRATPGEDLISALTRVSETSETLSDAQVVGFAILLMLAGNETTTNLLGNLLDRLADDPEGWQALRSSPARIEAAIEESLRADSPAQFVMRRTREAVVLGSATIPAGELVFVYLAAANRDPSKWSDPANFELARERERHLAFGHGVHTCIGAPLARLEAKAAMDALVARFGSLARGQTPGRRTGPGVLFGFRSLPLVFG